MSSHTPASCNWVVSVPCGPDAHLAVGPSLCPPWIICASHPTLFTHLQNPLHHFFGLLHILIPWNQDPHLLWVAAIPSSHTGVVFHHPAFAITMSHSPCLFQRVLKEVGEGCFFRSLEKQLKEKSVFLWRIRCWLRGEAGYEPGWANKAAGNGSSYNSASKSLFKAYFA